MGQSMKEQYNSMPKIDNMHEVPCKGGCDEKFVVKEYVISVICPDCYKKSKAS